MKKFLTRLIPVLLLAYAVSSVSAQPASEMRRPLNFPFAVGETLSYEGKIRKFALSATIGDLVFEVGDVSDDGRLQLKIEAKSRGTLINWFNYSFLQKVETSADAKGLHAFSNTKHDVQKEKIRDSFSRFDYENRKVMWVESNPKEPTDPPRTIASDLEGPTHDIVSAIYFMRTLPLAVGYTTAINVSDSGLVYRIPIRVVRRERQKTALGNVWCFRVEPLVFGPGRFFEQEGRMEIWITDDARRIPVRAQVNAAVGKVDIRLKSTKNLK